MSDGIFQFFLSAFTDLLCGKQWEWICGDERQEYQEKTISNHVGLFREKIGLQNSTFDYIK
jgi:hypothetical protein